MDASRPLPPNDPQDKSEIVIERPLKGQPHRGKVLVARQAHSDDIPLFAGGLVAKLMDEGYTGYWIRTSDDSKGDALGNAVNNRNIAKAYGMTKSFDLMYNHHQMDNMGIQDLKGRLIFLFRLLKVDTIVCWDPWEHYEENPDHYVTARAVEAARWMAGEERITRNTSKRVFSLIVPRSDIITPGILNALTGSSTFPPISIRK